MVKIGSGSHVYEIAEEWGELPKGIRYGYTNGVVVDSQDRVYVHSRSKDAVIVFNREGEFLTSWGEDFSRADFLGADERFFLEYFCLQYCVL